MATSTPTSSGGAETANDADTDLSGRAQPRDEMVENVQAAAAAVELPANATRPEAALPRVRFSLSASSGTSVDVRVELIDASESDVLPSSSPPPLLPGGYTIGEKLYYIGASETFDDGDRLVHGEQGVLVRSPIIHHIHATLRHSTHTERRGLGVCVREEAAAK